MTSAVIAGLGLLSMFLSVVLLTIVSCLVHRSKVPWSGLLLLLGAGLAYTALSFATLVAMGIWNMWLGLAFFGR